ARTPRAPRAPRAPTLGGNRENYKVRDPQPGVAHARRRTPVPLLLPTPASEELGGTQPGEESRESAAGKPSMAYTHETRPAARMSGFRVRRTALSRPRIRSYDGHA